MAAVLSIPLLREVWAAMDRIGCVVPPRPPLLRVGERRAILACLLEEEGKYPHPEDALDAYSVAIAWCAGQIAAGPDRAETGQAEGAKAKHKRGRKPGSKTKDKDTRLYLDWKAAHRETGITKAEFIRERGLSPSALASLERGRANIRRGRSSGRKKLDESSQDGSN